MQKQKESKTITYDGNAIFNAHFGLYGYEYVNYDESKEAIKHMVERKYLSEIKNRLTESGLKYVGLEYYSPREYNFATDSLDLKLKVVNKAKLKKQIEKHRKEIQKALDGNKSYDGYWATTVTSVEKELEHLENQGKEYEPDILVLETLLKIKIDQEDINEGLVFDPEDEEE